MHRLMVACTIVLIPCGLFGQSRRPYDCWRDQRNNTVNSCKYCHQSGQPGASNQDADRQRAHPVQENDFLNVIDPARLDDLVPPETIPADFNAFLALDNYRAALEARGAEPGIGTGAGEYKYFPDLDPEQTGPDGFANNGWRAFKWKPFELAWPAFIGRIQLNWIRLPDKFQRNAAGQYDLDTYKQNLDRLVDVIRGDVIDGTYLGMAADEAVIPYRFPAYTEFLHYLYYLDPDDPDMKATRIKEVRWNIKSVPEEFNQTFFGFVSAKERELSLSYREGDRAADYGMIYNQDGWDLIGFIEAVDGSLRPQTQGEMLQCIGCHSRRTGMAVDSHWQSLQRILPGEAGWQLQDYLGIRDYYNAGLERGELAEVFENHFGAAAKVPGYADATVNFLPDRATAQALNRRYYQIVQTQSYVLGREPKLGNPGFLVNPGTRPFRAEDQVEVWHPRLDFTRYEPAAVLTAVHTLDDRPLPAQLHLGPNYPNPFNSSTHIRFQVPGAGWTRLEVFNINGQSVRLLLARELQAGEYQITFDGRDRNNRPLASGLYLYRLTQKNQSLDRKMLLLR